MSQSLKNVLLIGAGGNLGPYIVSAISTIPDLNLSILARQSSKSSTPPNIKVHTISDTYAEDALVAAFTGQDAVIDLAPLTDVPLHLKLIDAAEKANVKRFIPPEFGSKTDEPRLVEKVPIYGARVAIKEYLKAKEEAGLTWTGVVNGGFFDMLLKNGWLGFNLAEQKATIYDAGTASGDLSLLSDVGKAVASILTHPAETANRYVYINTFQTNQNAILGALQETTGNKWEVTKASAKTFNEEGNAKIAKGDFSGVEGSIIGAFYQGEEWMLGYGRDNQLLLGRGSRSEDELKEAVDQILKGESI